MLLESIHYLNKLNNYPQSNSVQAPPLWSIPPTIVTIFRDFPLVLMMVLIPAGFSLQSYFGMQKSSTMDGSNTAGSFKVDDPASFMPPKIEITGLEAKRAAPPPRPHKLKPRDMNVLTPSGFWCCPEVPLLSHIISIIFFPFSPGLIYCSAFLRPPPPPSPFLPSPSDPVLLAP